MDFATVRPATRKRLADPARIVATRVPNGVRESISTLVLILPRPICFSGRC
jgi:hypothetical protein